jgi:hypothetical protein
MFIFLKLQKKKTKGDTNQFFNYVKSSSCNASGSLDLPRSLPINVKKKKLSIDLYRLIK